MIELLFMFTHNFCSCYIKTNLTLYMYLFIEISCRYASDTCSLFRIYYSMKCTLPPLHMRKILLVLICYVEVQQTSDNTIV